MRTLRHFLLASAALLLLTSGCPKNGKIIIISTSDIHAKIDRLPQFATLVDRYRAQDTAAVFLVDAGDRWTGNPYVDMAAHAGRPVIEQMNALGYDVATVGNHEFDFGLDTLQRRSEDAEFDIVVANVSTGRTAWHQPKPYVIKRAGCLKIGFIGMVTCYAGGHPDGDDAVFTGTKFYTPAETAARYGRKLRRKTDVLVVLSHLGLDRDTTDLLAAMPYADIIISGHTHETYAKIKDGVCIVQGLNSLKYVGVTTLTVESGKITDKRVEFVPLPAEGKPEVAEAVAGYKDNPYLTASIGSLAAAADKTALGQMIADVGRRTAAADIGIYHRGGTRLEGLESGSVSRADIFELEPFGSTYIVTEMTLTEMKDLIINKFNDRQNAKESHRVDLYPSGVRYTIVTDSSGDAVDVVFSPEVQKDIYKVAIGDYIYSSSTYKYARRAQEAVTKPVTELLIENFKENSPIVPDCTPRVSIVAR